MADLLFAFDQVEMNELVKNSKNDDIIISIFTAIDPEDKKGKLFLAAQSRTASATAGIPVGCPVPPGWNTIRPIVTQPQLVNTPSFTLSAKDKSQLEKPDAEKNKDQVLAALEGDTDGTSPLETKLSFNVKDKEGKGTKIGTSIEKNVTE